MKRLIFLFVFSIMSLVSFGQTFSCEEFQNDLTKFEQIQSKYKALGNKTWSKEIFKEFPCHNDGTITYEYVLKSDSTFNIEDLYTNILNWYKVYVPNAVPTSGSTNNHLSCICVLMGVGKAAGYMTYTFINAKEEITIDIKENRVKILVKVLQYISANTWNGAEVILPNSCYPCNSKGAQKDSHAMAFINCHYNVFETVKSLMKFLNDNISIIQNGEKEW